MKNEYFDDAISYGNMRRALNRVCRSVRWKDSVVGYELHAPQNTHKLIDALQNGTYRISPYQHFTVWEPKKRDIVATRISDRQVQMALCEAGLYEDITEHFIYDNSACQNGRGTDFALKRMKVHLLRYYREHGTDGWVLSCDIHHFFPETRHDAAKAAVGKRIRDARARSMVFGIIDSFGGEKGIGLGSQISQLTELAVLDDLDHFIKERLGIKHYTRYMDDLRLIHESKEYLEYCLDKITEKLSGIGFSLNKKTTLYPIRQGVKFLQWCFVLTNTGAVRMYMSGKKQGAERRRIRKLLHGEQTGRMPAGTAWSSLVSWDANARRGNTYYQRKRMKQFYETEVRKYGNNQGKAVESGAQGASGSEQRRREQGDDRLSCHDGGY